MAALQFPQLSRAPALKQRRSHLDGTLRDSMENGAEATRGAYTRFRRQWEVSIDLLTPKDVQTLDNFVTSSTAAFGGAMSFLFKDQRDPTNPQVYNVRFASLPAYVDAGNVANQFRQNCTFTLREM